MYALINLTVLVGGRDSWFRYTAKQLTNCALTNAWSASVDAIVVVYDVPDQEYSSQIVAEKKMVRRAAKARFFGVPRGSRLYQSLWRARLSGLSTWPKTPVAKIAKAIPADDTEKKDRQVEPMISCNRVGTKSVPRRQIEDLGICQISLFDRREHLSVEGQPQGFRFVVELGRTEK